MKRLLSIILLFIIPSITTAETKLDHQSNLEWAKNSGWHYEWSQTDFTKASLNLRDIMSGGVPKDGIPSIDNPKFKPVKDENQVAETEPVISVFKNGKAKAYPLRYLMFHEIVNDTFEGQPIAVTFCPLCNTSVVFERKLNGKIVEFGTTGKLHNSDLVMYDRLTETWWQQYNGKGIVGELTGETLKIIPSRLESLKLFKQRFPDGQILKSPNGTGRSYGYNPYNQYDSSKTPFLYRGDYKGKIPALGRVVVVGDKGYSMAFLAKQKTYIVDDIRITWQAGQNSALDNRDISKGRDVGNIIVQQNKDNNWLDVPYLVSFAFAFKAFNPGQTIITE